MSFGVCEGWCGTGKQGFVRSKLIVEANGGKCHGSSQKTIECTLMVCPGNFISTEKV